MTVKIPTLATVYLDNEPVGLMGDPKPQVAKIVVAAGRRPEMVQVLRARSANDKGGQPLGLEEIIDRTMEPTVPVYLTCVPKLQPPPIVTNLPPAKEEAPSARPGQGLRVPADAPEPRLPSPIAPLDP